MVICSIINKYGKQLLSFYKSNSYKHTRVMQIFYKTCYYYKYLRGICYCMTFIHWFIPLWKLFSPACTIHMIVSFSRLLLNEINVFYAIFLSSVLISKSACNPYFDHVSSEFPGFRSKWYFCYNWLSSIPSQMILHLHFSAYSAFAHFM